MKKTFTTEVSESRVVEISINGDLLELQIEELSQSLQEATEVIQSAFINFQEKLNILVDLSNFSGNYVVESLVLMVKFSSETKQYVKKTAIYGASDKDKMAVEMISALSDRSDLKTFTTKEEALEWLKAS